MSHTQHRGEAAGLIHRRSSVRDYKDFNAIERELRARLFLWRLPTPIVIQRGSSALVNSANDPLSSVAIEKVLYPVIFTQNRVFRQSNVRRRSPLGVRNVYESIECRATVTEYG